MEKHATEEKVDAQPGRLIHSLTVVHYSVRIKNKRQVWLIGKRRAYGRYGFVGVNQQHSQITAFIMARKRLFGRSSTDNGEHNLERNFVANLNRCSSPTRPSGSIEMH